MLTLPEDFIQVKKDGNYTLACKDDTGHVCIILNAACKCGFTSKNYQQLQEIYDEFGESKGLRILCFPSNQFAGQEPWSNEEIKKYVAENFNTKFDMFSKIDVNGDNAHPLWKFLKAKQGGTFGDFIKWNFTKFLIDKNGQPVARYAPNVEPNDIRKDFEKYW